METTREEEWMRNQKLFVSGSILFCLLCWGHFANT